MPPGDHERLTRYLLGELPDAEAEALEDECFDDDETQAALEAAEDDLVDAFVRGTLPPERLRAFESRYAASPELRERVQFARALLRMSDERAGAAAPPARRWTAAWAAAAALAAAVAGWALVDQRGARRERDTAVLQGGQRAREARELEARLRAAAEELERSRAEQHRLQGLLEEARRPLKVASFALAAGLTRDIGGTVLDLTRDTTVVRLHLALIAPPPPPLEAEIQTPEGRELWRARGLRPRPTAEGLAVTLTLGTDQLPDGDYVATVFGLDRGGRREETASFAFRVRRAR
jgi:hypothetical protein